MKLVQSVNEEGFSCGVFVSEGTYVTYDPVQRRLLQHLFEFVKFWPPSKPMDPPPPSLFDRLADATKGTGMGWTTELSIVRR
ncbi:hypothetical protein [Flexibacter flexilis]|nr:hypothetical protein [Flexibacter flexilis]